MMHLEEGTVVAIRDGSLVDGDAIVHLEGCRLCRDALEQARRRERFVSAALARLDHDVDLESAKAAVRERLDVERAADEGTPTRWRAHLGRAAMILALAAGGAYAMPGSPLRGWLGMDAAPATSESPATVTAPASTATEDAAPRGGVEVDLLEGSIRVLLSNMESASGLEVRWTEGRTARVVAAEGTDFTLAAGRVEARLAPGGVEVVLPRAATSVAVVVDGRTYLRRAAEGLEVLVPAEELTQDHIRFAPSGRE